MPTFVGMTEVKFKSRYPTLNYFFLAFCVSAEAATAFAALLAVLLRRILEAEEATLALVVSVLPFCVRADAATDFSAFVADLLLRTLEADDATFLLVLSDFAMDVASFIPKAAEVRSDEGAPCQIRMRRGIRQLSFSTRPSLAARPN
jgi:hypothetical protein